MIYSVTDKRKDVKQTTIRNNFNDGNIPFCVFEFLPDSQVVHHSYSTIRLSLNAILSPKPAFLARRESSPGLQMMDIEQLLFACTQASKLLSVSARSMIGEYAR